MEGNGTERAMKLIAGNEFWDEIYAISPVFGWKLKRVAHVLTIHRCRNTHKPLRRRRRRREKNNFLKAHSSGSMEKHVPADEFSRLRRPVKTPRLPACITDAKRSRHQIGKSCAVKEKPISSAASSYLSRVGGSKPHLQLFLFNLIEVNFMIIVDNSLGNYYSVPMFYNEWVFFHY